MQQVGCCYGQRKGRSACFSFTKTLRCRFDDEAAEAVDVVVIGGGIIGYRTAWFLLERGAVGLRLRQGPSRRRAVEPQLGLDHGSRVVTPTKYHCH